MTERLLLVPSFTELEWGIRPQLEEWAQVVTLDMPGTSMEPLADGLRLDDYTQGIDHGTLMAWREAGAERALAEVERRGWESFVVVVDSQIVGMTTPSTPSGRCFKGKRGGRTVLRPTSSSTPAISSRTERISGSA